MSNFFKKIISILYTIWHNIQPSYARIILICLIFSTIIFGSIGIPTVINKIQARQFIFLSPRIFADNQNDIFIRFVELRKKIMQYVTDTPTKLGVYFEYLPSGVSIGISEKDSYIFASLLKVPIVMAVYSEVEDGRINLNTKVTVEKVDLDNNFGSLWKKGVGTQLTILDVIRYTLTESDNTAKNILLRQLHPGSIDDVFKELDIPENEDSNGYVVSPKNYSSVLRSLYLASYISKEHSNDILSMLTQSHFDDKLVAGIPDTIHVAHKIGVYEPKTPNDLPVYTDCGIVYVPNRPYILCLMTKSNEDDARENMKNISKMVFDYVTKIN